MTKTGSSRFMSMFLSVCMIISCMVGMSLTAYADTTYGSYLVTDTDTAETLTNKVVKFNNIDWYIIADDSTAASAGSVTLLAKGNIGSSKFAESSTDYSSSDVKGYLDNLITTGNNFAGVADAIVAVSLSDVNVTGAKLWLLSTDEAKALPVDVRKGAGNWWLRNAHYDSADHISYAAGVSYKGIVTDVDVKTGLDVRPALKLDLSKVTFDSTSKTFTVGSSTPATTDVSFVRATSAEELETNLPNIPSYTEEQARAWVEANKATLAPAYAAHMQAHGDAIFVVVYAISEDTYYVLQSGYSDLVSLVVNYFSLGELKHNFTNYYDMIYYPEVTAATHTHTWGYNASGATITANCTGTGTCDITEGLTLTISAPTALTYDGTAKTATLSTGYNTTAFPGTYTIEYYNGTTKLDSAPVDAGTYTAKVTAGTGDGAATASVDFTITPKTVDTPTITLSPESFTYDGTAKQPTVTVKDGTTTIPASEYNVEYSNNTNAGTAKVTITDKTGGNYIVSGEKTFTIEKGSQSAPVVSSTNETIDGKADGTITGVTNAMEYKSASANAYTSVTGTTIANLPAGTYNVRYKENANYNASPAADVVINTGSKLTVRFDTDGGSPAPASQQLSYSQTVSAPAADPEKTGYTFLYWSADGEAEYDFSAPLTANITLKAVYQLNTYTITFIDNGNEYESQLEYGEALAEYIPRISWTGHTFMGWSPEVPETVPAEDMTFTAQWQVNQYTMTFDDNGSHSEYVLDYGTNLTDYIPDIQWEGHTFMGWNPEVPETVPAEDMTFTAVWDTNTYTITFDSNGGSYIAPIVQDYGTKVIAPMNPMREGYAFIGWDTEIPAEMPAYDMTVKALWVETPAIGAPRISSGTARVPSGTAQPEVTVSSTDEITPKMWAVLNDDNSVTVSWEKIKNADSYILYVEKNGKAVKLTETKGTEVTLKNAKNGVTYKFTLKYTRNGSTYSAPKGYKANLRVYYKPAVKAAVTKDGKILLKWNKVANADKYVIYRVNASGKFVKAGTTTKTAARIAAKSTDTGYVVRASVNGKLTKVTKSDIATAE